jgi:hypothetical protein
MKNTLSDISIEMIFEFEIFFEGFFIRNFFHEVEGLYLTTFKHVVLVGQSLRAAFTWLRSSSFDASSMSWLGRPRSCACRT